MAISKEALFKIISEKFSNAKINISDFVGDQNHYTIEIIDHQFKGMSLLNQHKMVQNALSEILKEQLHAVTIKTKYQ
ncbi:MAG: BolA family protein [Rickettsiaceae bacterium]